MKRRPVQIVAGVAALALLALGGTALGREHTSEGASKPIRLAAASVIVEVDATAGDAGLQFFLDGEPWRSMTISRPNRRAQARRGHGGDAGEYGAPLGRPARRPIAEGDGRPQARSLPCGFARGRSPTSPGLTPSCVLRRRGSRERSTSSRRSRSSCPGHSSAKDLERVLWPAARWRSPASSSAGRPLPARTESGVADCDRFSAQTQVESGGGGIPTLDGPSGPGNFRVGDGRSSLVFRGRRASRCGRLRLPRRRARRHPSRSARRCGPRGRRRRPRWSGCGR